MYQGCENCKYECMEPDQFPCSDCRNNFVSGTQNWFDHPFLWEAQEEVKDDVKEVKEDNPVTHPSHYTQGDIQCIDAMISAFGKEAVATWCKLNAFKYTWREQHKNGLEDIDKAIWYLNKYKELKSVG